MLSAPVICNISGVDKTAGFCYIHMVLHLWSRRLVVRTSPSHGEDQGFESPRDYHCNYLS